MTLISINEWNYLCPLQKSKNVLHVMIKVLEMDINFRNKKFDCTRYMGVTYYTGTKTLFK